MSTEATNIERMNSGEDGDTSLVEVDAIQCIVDPTFHGWNERGQWRNLYDVYKDFHRHPGVSGQEHYAAEAVVAFLTRTKAFLENADFDGKFDIIRDIGKDERTDRRPSVVAVMYNTNTTSHLASDSIKPKVVLLRADMDGLPVTEETYVDYKSEVNGVMHACGHDVHMTALLAAVQMMAENREKWWGTLIFLFQPAEESAEGAKGMVDGGLWERVPRPDAILGGHVTPEPTGTISLTKGIAYARSDSWKITIGGVGGHGSRPEACRDPIVCLAYIITRLQSIVARVVPSSDVGIITIGEIGGGKAENVIPDSAFLKLNIRSNSNTLGDKLDAEIRRVVAAEVTVTNPDVKVDWNAEDQEKPNGNPRFERISKSPLLANDDTLHGQVSQTFTKLFPHYYSNVPGVAGSEDLPYLAMTSTRLTEPDIPLLYWRYGCTDEETLKRAYGDLMQVPSNHSNKFLPQLDIDREDDPLKVATKALVSAALTVLTLTHG